MPQHHHKRGPEVHAGKGKPSILSGADDDKSRDGESSLHDDIRLSAFRKWEAAGKPHGDSVRFWLEAEQELTHDKPVKYVPTDGRHDDGVLDRREAEESFKAGLTGVDSHYRDNNRMFQSHGERGHRHGEPR